MQGRHSDQTHPTRSCHNQSVEQSNNPRIPTKGPMAMSRVNKKTIGRLFNYANNLITITGVVLTTLSALVIITFVVVELFGELENRTSGSSPTCSCPRSSSWA